MHVPNLVVGVTSMLYRFVMGAFGKSFPHPLRTNFCVPFWTTLFGVTVFLPFVLLGWLLRLLFGKDYCLKVISAVFVHQRSGRKDDTDIGPLVFFVLLLSSTVFLILGFVLDVEWFRVFGIFAVVFVIAVVVVAIAGATFWLILNISEAQLFSVSFGELANFISKIGRRPSLRKVLMMLYRFILIPVALIVGLVVVLHAIYKRYCPLVEMP